jgi:hypothetical protein
LIELKTPVEVRIPTDDRVIWQPAIVIGRTREETPRYDVMLPGGDVLPNIEAASLKVAA